MSGPRLSHVFRTWGRLFGAPSVAARRNWWTASDGETMGLGLACLALVASIPLEATLWGVDWNAIGLRRVGRLPASAMVTLFGGTWLLNAVHFDRLLGQRLLEPPEKRIGLRLVRSLIAGFPGLGLTSIPVWRSLAARRPAWAYGSGSGGAERLVWLRSERSPAPLVLGDATVVLWLVGLASLLLSSVWLAAPEVPRPGRRAGLLAAAAALHGAGLLGALAEARTLHRRGMPGARYLGAVCWLLPLPLTFGAFLSLGFDRGSLRQESLTWAAFARRGQPGRLGHWSGLQRSLRTAWEASPWWRRWKLPLGERRTPPLPSTDRDLLAACRVKLGLLLGDGLLLGWLLQHAGLDLERPRSLGCMLLIVVGGLLVGALVFVGRNLAAMARLASEPRPLGRHRQAWFGAVALAAVVLGLLVGSALAAGRQREAGLVLTFGVTAAQLFLGFGFMVTTALAPWNPAGAGAGLRWCGVLCGLMLAGGCVAVFPRAAGALLAMVFAMPLWHLLFFLAVKSRLARRFESGDGGERVDGSLPKGGRLQVLATALLPLGGLAVPSWLRVAG